MIASSIRKDFPILSRRVNGKKLVYLDNAATTQKPRQVIKAITEYYRKHNSNVHRAVHALSAEATEIYDNAHEKAAEFINADSYEEIAFTKNATESINIVASHFAHTLKKGDEIVITQMEHHSNIVPWLQAAKMSGAKVKYAEIDRNGKLKMEQLQKILSKKTKIVAVTHASNVLGTINEAKAIAEMAHDKNALVLVDGAQSVPHMPVDAKKIDADFLAFSGHKMLGPTGIGVLYGKRELLEKIGPFAFGGDMIREVRLDGATWNELPWKFEAGTPNMAGAAGLAAAFDYLKKIGMDRVRMHEIEITKYAMKKLAAAEVQMYGPAEPEKRGAVISFNIQGVHPHDASTILDSYGIAVRGGHHCAMPLMKLLGVAGTTRASFYIYNTKQEADALAAAIEKARKVMA